MRWLNVILAMGKAFPILLLAVAPLWAQARFEVSSVKPSRPGAAFHFNVIGDRFEASANTVGDILDGLNQYRLYRVVGGPEWMRTDRYDIVAKADKPIPAPEIKAAVMALLAERFHLETHTETRDTPGFTIRAPKMPKELKPAASDEQYSRRMVDGNVAFAAAPINMLVNFLSQAWGAPVEDQTKLEGKYDFRLATSQAEHNPGETFNDRLTEALEDIGFRVESRKLPIEITVVDRCERPSEN